MYAKELSTSQISEQIDDIYGFEVSEEVVSELLPQIQDCLQRSLSKVYPIVFIDDVHFSVRYNYVIKKLATYIILGINEEDKKEALNIQT